MNTAVVNKNINCRRLIVFNLLLRIVTLAVEPMKESRGNGVHPLPSLKFIPSINITDFILSIINTQAMNIGQRQVIVRSGMFTFESW